VDKLTEEQIQEFKLVFATFDRDRDGYIEKSDIAHVVKSLNLEFSEEQLADMLAEVDAGPKQFVFVLSLVVISLPFRVDGSGNVDFIEFLNMMARKIVGLRPQEQIKDAFDLLDASGHGTISLLTLHTVFVWTALKKERVI
jgi:Ca2+-binding EF-hand superfamily protein